MGHCDCASAVETNNQIKCIDLRNQDRFEYLLAKMDGKISDNSFLGKTKLAENLTELQAIGSNDIATSKNDLDIIKTKDELHLWISSETFVLSHLPREVIDNFFQNTTFADYILDGKRTRHVDSMYLTDLIEKFKFTATDLFALANAFGLSSKYFVSTFRRAKRLDENCCLYHPTSTCIWGDC